MALARPYMVIQRPLLVMLEQVWRGRDRRFRNRRGCSGLMLVVFVADGRFQRIAFSSVAAGYFYTASPVSLAYVALGELTVFIFMGPAIVVGSYFVMAMHFSSSAIWASIPLGFLVAGILHANNIRDIESDTRHGKRTLATILGRAGANYELIALDVAAYVTTIVAIIFHAIPWIALAVFITIPRALDQIRIMTRETDPKKLNLGLFRSIQLHMEFGLLMIAAFLTAAFIGW